MEGLELVVSLGEGTVLVLEGGKLSVGCTEHVVHVCQAIDKFCPHVISDLDGSAGVEVGV